MALKLLKIALYTNVNVKFESFFSSQSKKLIIHLKNEPPPSIELLTT